LRQVYPRAFILLVSIVRFISIPFCPEPAGLGLCG
jgi:hypothetical protein